MFGSALLCPRCGNLSDCNFKIEVNDRISKRFIGGEAVSAFFPRVVVKHVFLITVFYFLCTFLI